MTLDEMIERLQQIKDDYDIAGDTTITGAFQPGYPLTASIDAITTIVNDAEGTARIYIALGDGRQYGSRDMWTDDLIDEETDDNEDEDGDDQ